MNLFDVNCIIPSIVLGYAFYILWRSAAIIRRERIRAERIEKKLVVPTLAAEIIDGVVMDEENRDLCSLYWWAGSRDWKDKNGHWHRFKY